MHGDFFVQCRRQVAEIGVRVDSCNHHEYFQSEAVVGNLVVSQWVVGMNEHVMALPAPFSGVGRGVVAAILWPFAAQLERCLGPERLGYCGHEFVEVILSGHCGPPVSATS